MNLSRPYQFLLLVFVTLGIYYPSLFSPFNLLDDQVLVGRLLNEQGFSWAQHFSPGGGYDYYRPLLSLSYEIDKHVGGLQETFMHLVNVLVHLLNVILLWTIARRFGEMTRRSSPWLPLFAAMLFALHPLNSEAVNWIAGRTDLLAGTFVFVALYFLLEYVERRTFLAGVVSALAVLGGALCKETALFFIPAACFLLFCQLPQGQLSWRQRLVLPGLYGVAVFAYFVLRWGAFQTDRGLQTTAMLATQLLGQAPSSAGESALQAAPAAFSWIHAATAAVKASGFYAVKLVQPLPLNFAIHRIDAVYLAPGIALLLGLALLAWCRRLGGWFFLASASVAVSALFVLFTGLAWTPIAERYMYIPCGLFVIGLVFALERYSKLLPSPLPLIFAGLLLMTMAVATVERNRIWQDNLTLYEDTVKKSPDFAPARNQLAVALKMRNRLDEANQLLLKNQSSGGDAAALNAAVALTERGDYSAARDDLLKRLASEEGYQASRTLELLIRITTTHLGKIQDEALKQAGYRDMLVWLEALKEITPDGFNYYRIGRVQLILKNRVEAQRAFAEAARRLPDDSIYKEPAAKLARNLEQ